VFVLTDPSLPKTAIPINQETLALSLAIVDQRGQVIGGACNETMPALEVAPMPLQDDPFLMAIMSLMAPILALLPRQDAEVLTALCTQYPAFRVPYAKGKVGHHFMVARSDPLAKGDRSELVAASAAPFQALGYAFMAIEATHQWTGAACEALGGVRVHFATYQGWQRMQQSAEPLAGILTSANGWPSNKDSGSMF